MYLFIIITKGLKKDFLVVLNMEAARNPDKKKNESTKRSSWRTNIPGIDNES